MLLNRQVNVRLSEKDYDGLARLAKTSDRKLAYMARRAITEYVKKIDGGRP